jgi:hypothetical protein
MSTKRPDPERDAYRLALERIAYGKINPSSTVKPYPGTECQEMARRVLIANGVVEWRQE